MIPQFSVCIPAYRNPATLEACLRTVLDQPGDDYEIVVSDDQGPPGIRALVERLAQPDRIRYLRTPQRLGLRGNFEHCVTHSRGRYVTILGDDDGLCRNALDVARTLLASAQPDVFFWFPHIYWWPDALLPHKRWMVYVRAYAQKARLVNAREYVDRFYDDPRNLWLFERLPSIYNGFVCRDLLERIRHRIGGYFYDEVADVSSGIVNGIMATSAALVERPLSIRGLSGSSSGVAFRSKEAGRPLSDDFLRGMHTPCVRPNWASRQLWRFISPRSGFVPPGSSRNWPTSRSAWPTWCMASSGNSTRIRPATTTSWPMRSGS